MDRLEANYSKILKCGKVKVGIYLRFCRFCANFGVSINHGKHEQANGYTITCWLIHTVTAEQIQQFNTVYHPPTVPHALLCGRRR